MSYFDQLNYLKSEFTSLGALKENERPSQKEDDSFGVPYSNLQGRSITRFGSTLYNSVQNFNRTRNKDSTDRALKHIDSISEQVNQLVGEKFTQFDFFNNFSLRLEKLKELYNIMVCEKGGKVDVSEGLHNFKETALKGDVNSFSRSEDTKIILKEKFQSTKEKLLGAAQVLKDKIKQYKEIQTLGYFSSTSEQEHVENLLQMLLNPVENHDVFAKKMSLKKLACIDTSLAQSVLINAFGEDAVIEVGRMYKTDTKADISYEEFQCLVIGIVANLKLEDIKAIIDMKKGAAYDKIKDFIPEEGLNEESLISVLETLRNVDFGGVQKIATDEFREQFDGDYQQFKKQFDGDYSFIVDSCNSVEQYNFTESNYDSPVQALKKYGYSEHLARYYAYSLFATEEHQFRDGILFPQYDGLGKKVCRQATSLVNKDAVMAMGVSPVPGISENADEVQVVFRGTYDEKSIVRDFNPFERDSWRISGMLKEAPGKKTFQKHKNELIANTETWLKNLPFSEYRLLITGHSLGATDANTMQMETAARAASDPDGDVYGKISEINLNSYNSPGFDKAHGISFNKSARTLEGKKTFEQHAFSTYHDVVHEFGYCLPGYVNEGSEETPTNVTRTWIRFHYKDGSTAPNCGGELYNTGSMQAVTTEGTKKYTAHSASYFSEDLRGQEGEGKMNKVYVHSICTENEYDSKYAETIDDSRRIPAADINKVLLSSFAFDVYRKGLLEQASFNK
ncbi:MAG: hypothetical protein VX777_01660 [Chlamydiota bacterium]|nr:hypothetical protein [Chlamydiota bacterium]